jgi:hypothetical protein
MHRLNFPFYKMLVKILGWGGVGNRQLLYFFKA